MDTTDETISIICEIPEHLHDSMRQYLKQHKDWDYDRLLTAALSLYLLQSGEFKKEVGRAYLDATFGRVA